jgi:hypothetical protein
VVVIDTDVLLLELAYPRDKRFAVNATFLKHITQSDPAVTIYNSMELLGQLSFNLAPTKLAAWQSWLIDAYQLTVIWPVDPSDLAASAFFRAEIFERPFAKMREQRMAFMDSLILQRRFTNVTRRSIEPHTRYAKSPNARCLAYAQFGAAKPEYRCPIPRAP